MGSKSYTTVTDDRDVVSGADQSIGIIGSHTITIHDPKAAVAAVEAAESIFGTARTADLQLTESFLAAFGEARAGEQALLDAALAEAARGREADQALLAAALTPEAQGGDNLLRTLQILGGLGAAAWVLSAWAR